MDASRPRNVLIAFCLIVGGGVSILHHGLACGVFFRRIGSYWARGWRRGSTDSRRRSGS